MNIDKSKLQPLLWAVVGAWKVGDQDLHLHTDTLDEFLGASTVEEVSLGLLEEIERLEAWRTAFLKEREAHICQRDQLKAENEKMRSFLAEVSRTSGDKWAVMAARNLLEDVDHG